MRVILNMPVIYYYGFLSLLAAIGGSYALGADRDPARKNQLSLPIIDVQAWARDPELTLPSNQTTLRVVAHQPRQVPNPLIYKWVKVGGPPSGTVTFAPNGDGYSDRTTATFSANVAGTYTLRAIITNGLTETISEVDVTIEPGSDRTQRPSRHRLDGNVARSPARYRAERIGKRVVYSRADRVIVRLDVGTGPGHRGRHRLSTRSHALMELLGARVSKTWFQGRLGLVELGSDIDPSVLNRLRALPEFRYVVADDHAISLADYVPNDPKFGSQWGLENSADVDINATLAWDQTTGSSGTLVAVLDTGIDYTHPDLYLAIAINNYEIPESIFAQLVDTNATGSIDFYDLNSLDANGAIVLDEFGAKFNQGLVTDINGNGYIDAGDLQIPNWCDGVDGDGNGYVDDLTGWDLLSADNDVLDTHGHGTHVAGIIAARGDNEVGVAGVNWRAQILPVRFQNGDGGQISDVIQAIEYSVAMGANVINASWGTFIDNPALKDAIQFAGDDGAVFVAAAGNHANDIDDPAVAYYPAAYTDLSNLIGVASVSSDGNLSSFSNYGVNSVDLAAPGASVLSTGLGGDYILWSGTSMAAPHVAGVVSLVAGLFPDESPDWLVNHVLATVKPLPDLATKTWTGGMVDAFLAVDTPSIAGPRIVMATPIGNVLGPIDRVVITFDSAIAAATFTTADVDISGPGAPIIPTSVHRLSDFIFEVVFPVQATIGAYTVQVGPDVEDSLGRVMDQDRDGNAGEPLDDQFNTTFRLVTAPQAWILDDGDAGYSPSGSWTTYTGVGTEGDFAYKAVGSGAATASWTQAGLAPGEYRVSVTWEAYTNRAVDVPYTVLDGAVELGTVMVDQRQAPVGFVEEGVSWQDLGFYQLNGDTLVVRLSDAAHPSGSYVIADAIRVEHVGDGSPEPELQVLVNGVEVADGTGTVDFGSTLLGAPLSKTIMVRNAGAEDLLLGVISLPDGFSLVADFGSTLLGPGQTTDFVVQLDAALEGDYTGVMSFGSNDANENPYDFSAWGTVSVEVPPGSVSILDDGDAGYSPSGSWTTYTGVGTEGDFAYKAVGSGAATASWTQAGLAPGEYRVSVTWEAYTNRAVDVPYTVLDGAVELGTVMVDQRQVPVGFVEEGVSWQDLGFYQLNGDTLVVRLSDAAHPSGSYVIADAIRVEHVGDGSPEPELQVLVNGVEVADGTGTVDFGSTLLGAPLSKTIMVRNAGAEDLLLGVISLPDGFSLVADFGSTLLGPGQTTDFVVQLDAALEGDYTGVMSFGSNDANENPYDFSAWGTVSVEVPPGSVSILDDGDAGYSPSGSWTTYTGVGTEGDFAYKAVGSGAATASWTQAGLAPGEYRVSVTWEAYTNRAVDVPYTVLDGAVELGTVMVDQRQAPVGFVEEGVSWQDLGFYQLNGDTLVVRLSDAAHPSGSYVIADAIRVERVGP